MWEGGIGKYKVNVLGKWEIIIVIMLGKIIEQSYLHCWECSGRIMDGNGNRNVKGENNNKLQSGDKREG